MTYPIDPYKAIDQLADEFPRVPKQLLIRVFRSYVRRGDPVPEAARATRARIIHAAGHEPRHAAHDAAS